MPVVAENGFFFHLSHRGTGYSTGATETIEHNIAATGISGISVHVGISRVQATTGGPLGAAVGVMIFGGEDFGPDPANWRTAAYGNPGTWTVAGQVTKGD